MSTAQKIIKYLAIAFALFIIFNIVSGILFGVLTLAGVLGLKGNKVNIETKASEVLVENDVTSLEDIISDGNSKASILNIELSYSNLTIKSGETLKVESNNKNISCKQDNNRLVIKENDSNWFAKGDSSELIVYIPREISFESAKVETGAGEINIESLNAQKLSFSIGAVV